MIGRFLPALCAGACMVASVVSVAAAHPEYNAVRTHAVAIGPEASRLLVGFRATGGNVVVQTIHSRARAQSVTTSQALTSASDVTALAQRVKLNMAKSRQLTPSMHVMYLQKTLYGADVEAALKALRADSAVKFAAVDQLRYPHAVPDDPLFQPTPGTASGQWFMKTPSSTPVTVEGVQTTDLSATDAVSAWDITKGSTGTVIADVDTGVRFDHPDLLRAGFGGRLLPGYDFVDQDYDPTSGAALGTFLMANDGDGWDPDPSDPGDWISTSDLTYTDSSNNLLFPPSTCGSGSGDNHVDSSWHGTRVMGILGALTNNSLGVAGMTWNPYLLPVRALGKCGGYDSDIITGMQWAAGMTVTGVPNNPYPADIINLSLGGSGTCSTTSYPDVISTLTGMGVLVVVSAGNEGGAVDVPANCDGVLGVVGLRNVGTKVGYSSFGAEAGVAAPAGNCVNSSGACLRSLDTTANTGLTVPGASTYTDESNTNLGTSFSAPIVSGVAALMRAVNANLTPAQLIARIKSSATGFPQPSGVAVCSSSTATNVECACPNDGTQCGAGMVNALQAVTAAERPIAAVSVPTSTPVGSSATLDASGSAASCGRTVVSYAWVASGGVTIQSGANAAQVMITPTGTAGTLTLTVTDSANATDTAILTVGAGGSITLPATTTASAGTSACPTALTVTPAAPTVSEAFSPASVGENVVSTLTITLANANGFVLTQSSLTDTLPANLNIATSSGSTSVAPATTCGGAKVSLTSTTSAVTLSGANIPVNGSCTVTVPVKSAAAGTYTNSVAAGALTTGPAGANAVAATADLTVTAPSKSGGGAVDGWDTLFVVGVLLAGRRYGKRKPPLPGSAPRH